MTVQAWLVPALLGLLGAAMAGLLGAIWYLLARVDRRIDRLEDRVKEVADALPGLESNVRDVAGVLHRVRVALSELTERFDALDRVDVVGYAANLLDEVQTALPALDNRFEALDNSFDNMFERVDALSAQLADHVLQHHG